MLHSSDTSGYLDQLCPRELELELLRLRAAAEAARLDARAAEVELLLRQSARRQTAAATQQLAGQTSWPLPTAATAQPAHTVQHTQAATLVAPVNSPSAPANGPVLVSWQTMLAALQQAEGVEHAAAASSFTPASVVDAATELTPTEFTPVTNTANQIELAEVEPAELESNELGGAGWSQLQIVSSEISGLVDEPTRVPTSWQADAVDKLAADDPVAAKSSPRRRRAAWLLSTVVHAMLLFLLAMITISIESPKDQVALSAAATQPTEEPIAEIQLEQAQQPAAAEPANVPEMVEPTLDAVGEIVSTSFDITQPAVISPSGPAATDLGDLLSSPAGGQPSDMASQFFGLSGGGNHFVYLVDNSGSMDQIARDGFDVARRELLRAVDQLTAEQRFYVIFFGEQTLRMRMDDPTSSPSRSVYATQANKAALRRWAMTIEMQPGKWPEEALEFAFELRPDSIFLLTDGQMSQRVVPLIREGNIVETLLDGPKPRSRIHTIGFHNREGEAQLQAIAKANGGSYRFVPPTDTFQR